MMVKEINKHFSNQNIHKYCLSIEQHGDHDVQFHLHKSLAFDFHVSVSVIVTVLFQTS